MPWMPTTLGTSAVPPRSPASVMTPSEPVVAGFADTVGPVDGPVTLMALPPKIDGSTGARAGAAGVTVAGVVVVVAVVAGVCRAEIVLAWATSSSWSFLSAPARYWRTGSSLPLTDAISRLISTLMPRPSRLQGRLLTGRYWSARSKPSRSLWRRVGG